MKPALDPSGEHPSSWEQRQALGQAGALGQLYDARSDKVLPEFILKDRLTPEEAVHSMDLKQLRYKETAHDTLEEKFSSLQVAGELRASLLCNLLTTGWGATYFSTAQKDYKTSQASVICSEKTKHEVLLLANANLRKHLHLDALSTSEATHVICGIEWGAQAIVTAKLSTTRSEQTGGLGAHLGNGQAGRDSERNAGTPDEGIFSTVLRAIGEGHVAGNFDSEDALKQTTSSWDFQYLADVGDRPGHPKDIDEVMQFLAASKECIKTVNDGKGVPVTFHLRPIDNIADSFGMTLKHNTIARRLDEECVNEFVALLDEHSAIKQKLTEYEALLTRHLFCVPQAQLSKARKLLKEAKKNESWARTILSETVRSIRKGDNAVDKLWEELDDLGGNTIQGYPLVLTEYVDKIDFVNVLTDLGAIHKNPMQIDAAIMSSGTDELYVFYFDEATRHHCDWDQNRRKLIELLHQENRSYGVLVVDHDIGAPNTRLKVSSEQRDGSRLTKPYIEQRRRGRVTVANIVEDERELANICLVKCNDDSKVDRSQSYRPPPGKRAIRIPCPGNDCHSTRTVKFRWTCPACRQQVSYGFTDDFLYCQCGRYLYSLAVFKCRNERHDVYDKHDDEHLLGLLKDLDSQEIYNILILGESGVGKSMFINAFYNYRAYATLSDAMADPRELQYLIPCTFRFGKKLGFKTLGHSVAVGKGDEFEWTSGDGQSATRNSGIYRFKIDGKVINLIDTPGLGDTGGIDRDRENMRDILRTLEHGTVKLNAILILLRSDSTRISATFQFCLTELLRHLHRDASKNILFGFTNAAASHWSLGATDASLSTILNELGTGIVRGDENQFFFDSEGFMYVADFKENGRRGPDRDLIEESWSRSADSAYRLVTTAMNLPPHEVKRTLKMNRVRGVLEGMTQPLMEFTITTKKSQDQVKDLKKHLEGLDTKSQDLLESFKVPITVAVAHRLESPRVVCGHPSCCGRSTDDPDHLTYNTVCHDKCDLKAADGVPGDGELWWCQAFRRAFIFRAFSCWFCEHEWQEHLRISTLYTHEKQHRTDETISQEAKGRLDNLEDRKQEASRRLKFVQDTLETISEEDAQIKRGRAAIAIYLKHNALALYNDATLSHIDYQKTIATRVGNQAKVVELEEQKKEHKGLVAEMKGAIIAGGAPPSDEDMEAVVQGLKDMKIFGRHLAAALRDELMFSERGEIRSIVAPSRVSTLKKWAWPF